MALAETFQEIVDSLPSDWTDLELDLRVQEEPLRRRHRPASLQINAQPYSHHDWHWRLLVAHQFGHAAAAPAVHGTLGLLDEAGIEGELVLRELRTRARGDVQMWGRRESVRQEFRRIRVAVAVARVVAVFDDLLLGSNVLGMLRAAGHEASWPARSGRAPGGADVLVVDLGCGGLRRRRAGRAPARRAVSWGRADARRLLPRPPRRQARAEAAGFDLVVPRSRMAREGAALVERLADRLTGALERP